jgi:hypothetical protein
VPQDVRSNIPAESGVSNDLIERHGDALNRLAAPLNGIARAHAMPSSQMR